MALTEKGYQRPSYPELVEAKVQRARDLFGEDIETSEQTALGKFIRINAYDLAKLYEDLERVYYARFPNTATGINLDRLCVYAGITRSPGSRAIHTITVQGKNGLTLPVGTLVRSDSGVLFRTVTQLTFTVEGDGFQSRDVQVECTEIGPVGNVAPKTINGFVNPMKDIKIAAGSSDRETDGVEPETDEELRKRFTLALMGAGACNGQAIRGALLRIDGVDDATVHEYEDGTLVEEETLYPHSFECVVYSEAVRIEPSIQGASGGHSQEQQTELETEETEKQTLQRAQKELEIAKAILEKKPIGIKAVSTAAQATGDKDVSYRADCQVEDSAGETHSISFTWAKEKRIKVEYVVVKNTHYQPEDEQALLQAVEGHVNGLGIGQPLEVNSLYRHIYNVPGVAQVTGLNVYIFVKQGAITDEQKVIGTSVPCGETEIIRLDAVVVSEPPQD